jgi:hypothetical protein
MAKRTKRRMSSRIGMAITTVGVLLLTFGLFTGSAGAWEGSCYDSAPYPGAWTEMRAAIGDADFTMLTGAGQNYTDGKLSVVLSGPAVADISQPLSKTNVGSINFSANLDIEAVYIRAGRVNDVLKLYSPSVLSDTGLHAKVSTAPIDWVTFCYNPQNNPTTTRGWGTTTGSTSSTTSTTTTSSTTSTTTTTTTTTTLAPTTVAGIRQAILPESTVGPTTTTAIPTEVLGVQVVRPQVLAFSGGHEKQWAMTGLAFMFFGVALMLVDRFALKSRGHTP